MTDRPRIERALGREVIADTLGELFWHRVNKSPDEPGIRFNSRSFTYAEMAGMVTRVRLAFRREKLKSGTRIATYMYNSPWLLAIFLACAMERMVYCPINPSLRKGDLAYILGDLGPGALFVDGELSPVLQQVDSSLLPKTAVEAESLDSWLPPYAPLPGRPQCEPGDPLCIIYSGGTTGLPKGIVMPQFAPVAAALRFNAIADFREKEIYFSVLQLSHAWTPLLALSFCLYYGHTFCFWKWWSASRFVAALEGFQATLADPFIGMIATLLQVPAQAGDGRLEGLRVVGGMGGADAVSMRLRSDFEERFGAKTFDLYGFTEATGLVAVETEHHNRKRGSSGQLSGWYDVAIVDANDMPVPSGTSGEILVRPLVPYTVGLGYHNKAEATAHTWRNLWIHTGDFGYLDEEGYLFFAGRKNHFLRRRGELISAAEVENLIMSYPGVVEVAVVAARSDFGEDEVRACVVSGDAEFDPAALIAYCRDQVASFKVPRFVDRMESLPRTGAKREIERYRLQERPLESAWDSSRPERFPVGWPQSKSESH